MRTRGEGVKNPKNFVNVLYGWSLKGWKSAFDLANREIDVAAFVSATPDSYVLHFTGLGAKSTAHHNNDPPSPSSSLMLEAHSPSSSSFVSSPGNHLSNCPKL